MQSRYLEALQQPLESPEPAASPSSPLSFVVSPLSSPKSVLPALPFPLPPTDDIFLPVPVLRSLLASESPALPGQDVDPS